MAYYKKDRSFFSTGSYTNDVDERRYQYELVKDDLIAKLENRFKENPKSTYDDMDAWAHKSLGVRSYIAGMAASDFFRNHPELTPSQNFRFKVD